MANPYDGPYDILCSSSHLTDIPESRTTGKKKVKRGNGKTKPKKTEEPPTITVTTTVKKTIKNPALFLLGGEEWKLLNSAQLGRQCKIVGIPTGGSKEEKLDKLIQWRKRRT